jgi:membrane protease YdiL (CAAX protease family)
LHAGRTQAARVAFVDTPPFNPTPPDPAIVLARPIEAPRAPAAPLDPLLLAPLSRGTAAWYIALLLAVAVGVPLAIDIATIGVSGGAPNAELLTPDYLVARKVFDVGVIGLLAWLLLSRNRLPVGSVGLSARRPASQALWALLALGAIYAYMLVFLLIMTVVLFFFPSLQKDLAARTEFLDLMPVDDVWMSLALLIPVAIHEELLFRGLLLPYLRRVTGGWTAAILLSSVIFAVLHLAQGWLGVVQVFGLSIIFSLAFLWTRSLVAVTVAHFLFDFLQFQLIRALRPLFDQLPQLPT